MPEVKQFLTPKILIPLISLFVLVVVAILITIFYIRNPTITDGIFSQKDDSTTQTPYEAAKEVEKENSVASSLESSSSNQSDTGKMNNAPIEVMDKGSHSSSVPGVTSSTIASQSSSIENTTSGSSTSEHIMSPAPAA